MAKYSNTCTFCNLKITGESENDFNKAWATHEKKCEVAKSVDELIKRVNDPNTKKIWP